MGRRARGDRQPGGELGSLVREMIGSGGFSAVSAVVGDAAEPMAAARAGSSRSGRPLGPDDRFDIASLTKPVVATVALLLARQRRLPLELQIGEIWERAHAALARRRLADLLRHRAGLRPWTPLYLRCVDRHEVAGLIVAGELGGAAEGTYSDLGYILWALSAERALGAGTAELVAALLEPAIGPLAAGFGDVAAVECRLDNEREIELAAAQGLQVPRAEPPPAGTPQDGNARFLGAAAGHAGLFASAATLYQLGREWLAPGGLLSPAEVKGALGGAPGPWALGWARPESWQGGGAALSRECFGHLGFTGGSLWIDPAAGRVAVLLAHRTSVAVDPDPWRRRLHRLVLGPAQRGRKRTAAETERRRTSDDGSA